MAPGRFVWQMNPNVRSTIALVRQLKEIANSYYGASGDQERKAAQREWAEAVRALDGRERRPRSRSVASRAAA